MNNKNEKVYKEENHDNVNMLPGDLSRSSDESFSDYKDTLFFIDEAFLSKLSKYFGEGKYLKFDRLNFAEQLSENEKLSLKNIFLYIAPPFQSHKSTGEEEVRKKGYDNLLIKLKNKGIVVREGRCQRLKIDGMYKYGQKAVDILLAMDLMQVPLKYPLVKRIILISSDSDFVPVIKSLAELGVKTVLYTYYEKNRNSIFSRSNHLIKSVHKYVLLSKKDFEGSALEGVKNGN